MRDALGNPLEVGQTIAAVLERPLLIGNIMKIEENRLVLGGPKGQQAPAVVTISVAIPIALLGDQAVSFMKLALPQRPGGPHDA